MIKYLVLAFLFVGVVRVHAEVETFKPQAVSSNDCQLSVMNSDTGEVFVPNLKPLEASMEWPGSKYLQVWLNEYPVRQRLVSVTPYKGSDGHILVEVLVEWETTDIQKKETIEKNFNVTFAQNPDQTFDFTVIQEKYESHDSGMPYNTHPDPKNFYSSWEKPTAIENIQSSDGTVKVAYTSRVGLNITGECKFSGSVDAPGPGKTKQQLTSLF
jgi:hypothetical protein